MSLIPYTVDLQLKQRPTITMLVTLLCVFVFLCQRHSEHAQIGAAESYCSGKQTRYFRLALQKVHGGDDAAACMDVMLYLHWQQDHAAAIARLAGEAPAYQTLSREKSRAFTTQQLTQAYKAFARLAPPSLNRDLVYHPRSYNVPTMFTSAVSHADWMHLIGNLFFFAFAATVEVIVGVFLFPVILAGLAVGTSLAYSLSMLGAADPLPTLGLSGVVSGMIGLFAYFLPQAKIRCFIWFGIPFGTLAVPAWILAGWYVGWDIYYLAHSEQESGINFVAHVAGALIGFFLGAALFSEFRTDVQASYKEAMSTRAAPRAREHPDR